MVVVLASIFALAPCWRDKTMSQTTKATRPTARPIVRTERLEPRRLLAAHYVAIGGNDAGPGTADAPWSTLQHAANSVGAGDTVIVRQGRYAGFNMQNVDVPATAENRIVFHAEPGAVIDRPNGSTHDGINLEGVSYVTIEGFKVTGMPRTGIRSVTNAGVVIRNNVIDRSSWWGILTGFSEGVLIEGNTTSNSVIEHGIYVGNSADNPVVRNNVSFGNRKCGIQINSDASQGGDGIITGALVEGNILYGNGAGGGSAINFDGVQKSTVRNNLIYATTRNGIALFHDTAAEPATDNVIANNTIVGTGYYSVSIANGSTGNAVFNNILYTSSSRGSILVSRDSLAGFTSDYNAVVDRFNTDSEEGEFRTFADWQNFTGQDQHSFLATPNGLFVNAPANDYHLKPGSPATNAATTLHLPSGDLEGNLRPQGNGSDIGAFERNVLAIQTPAPATTLYSGNVVVVRYTPAATAPDATQVVFRLDAGPDVFDTAYTGSYTFPNVPTGDHTLRAYLARSDGSKVPNTDVVIPFATAPIDTTPPVINDLRSSATSTHSASIEWTTNEPGGAQVEYGTTTGYGSQTEWDPAPVTVHQFALLGLTTGTLYHYRVRVTDPAGNTQYSPDMTFTTPTQSQGLVAYFPFDEGAGTTVSGGGSLTGTVSGATFVHGVYGTALDFDGVDDIVTVPETPALDLTTGMTIEAWVRPGIISKTSAILFNAAPNDSDYAIYAQDTDGAFGAWVTTTETTRGATTRRFPAPDQWTHLAATYDGSWLRFYVNGAEASSVSVGGPLLTSHGSFTIGGDEPFGEFFRGLVDEVRVYSLPLTESEIVSDMNAGTRPVDPLEPNNTFTTATNLGTVSLHLEHDLSIHSGTDEDYFKFVPAVTGAVDICLSYVSSAGNLNASLYRDENGTYVELASSVDISGGSRVTAPVTAGTTYYLRVSAAAGAPNPAYSLTIAPDLSWLQDDQQLAYAFAGTSANPQLVITFGSGILTADPSAAIPNLSIVLARITALRVQSNLNLASLSLGESTAFTIDPGGNRQITTKALQISTGAQLDLNEHSLVLNMPDPLDTALPYLTSAYDHGKWDGTGIISGLAVNTANDYLYGVGYALQGANALLVRYARYGDANLDDRVDGDDAAALVLGQATGGTGWSAGNFNYDAEVDADDYMKFGRGVASFSQAAPAVAEVSRASQSVGPAPIARRTTPMSLASDRMSSGSPIHSMLGVDPEDPFAWL
jgi:hypothetical protein